MAHKDTPMSLTAQLYSPKDIAVRDATRHPFLEHAGKGTLSASTLCTWLVQDKYYQLAYVNFIGDLLAKLPLTSCPFPHSDKENLPWMTLDVLISAITNIREEIKFYNKTIEKYGLLTQEAPPTETTRQYIKLFEDASAKHAPLIHGLVVLWATEKCYFEAWSFASSKTSIAEKALPSVGSNASTTAALHKEFIPNWTSKQFGDFVNSLAALVDLWARTSDPREVELSKEFFSRVLTLEASFWPGT